MTGKAITAHAGDEDMQLRVQYAVTISFTVAIILVSFQLSRTKFLKPSLKSPRLI